MLPVPAILAVFIVVLGAEFINVGGLIHLID